MKPSPTRERIVETADLLFYQRGYEHTSFADIADAVGISRGNFYYYFKAKDDILDAVIDSRLANTRKMLERWEQEAESPGARIRCFIKILIVNQSKIMLYGCPVGTLTTELAKLNHIAQDRANAIFSLFHTWLCTQFEMLGCNTKANDLAMHVLARSQGVATLAHAFRDERFVQQEVEQMCRWLAAYDNNPIEEGV